MDRPMTRNRQEWWDFCMKHGTNGSQVFDILTDWKLESQKMLERLTAVRDAVRLEALAELTEMIDEIEAISC